MLYIITFEWRAPAFDFRPIGLKLLLLLLEMFTANVYIVVEQHTRIHKFTNLLPRVFVLILGKAKKSTSISNLIEHGRSIKGKYIYKLNLYFSIRVYDSDYFLMRA